MESLLENTGLASGWQNVVEKYTGWKLGPDFLPSIPAALVLYLSTFVIGLILHQVTKYLAPRFIRGYLLDFIKTMTICTYPFGHGIMRKYYGEPGYFCSAVPVVYLTLSTLQPGDGNPIMVWLQFFKRSISLQKCLLKTAIQIAAGFAAYRLGMFILSSELHPVYVARMKDYYNQFCETDLHVPSYVGFAVEFFAVIYDTWFWCQTLTGRGYIDMLLKIMNSALLVVAGVHLTGMYIHPAMATGHTWGCGQTTRMEHIAIYWVGPAIGTWISMHIAKRFSVRSKSKSSSKPKSSNDSVPAKGQNGTQAVYNAGGQGKKHRNTKKKYYHQ